MKKKRKKKPVKKKWPIGLDGILFLAIVLAGAGYFFHYLDQKQTFTKEGSMKEGSMDSFIAELERKETPPAKDSAKEKMEKTESVTGKASVTPVEQVAPVIAAVTIKKPVAAIIIDDVGMAQAPVRKLLSLRIPITFSILPGLPHSKDIAQMVSKEGHEVMLHLPMEPEDTANNDPGQYALLISYDEDKIRKMVGELVEGTPNAAGMNNHMGSLFTKDPEKMRIVMDEIKKKGLFFIDSYTTPKSVALDIAREAGLKTAGRDIFLDNDRNEEAVKRALRRTIARAKKKGHAIAIGHPHPATIRAIAALKEDFESEGVRLVYVSEAVR